MRHAFNQNIQCLQNARSQSRIYTGFKSAMQTVLRIPEVGPVAELPFAWYLLSRNKTNIFTTKIPPCPGRQRATLYPNTYRSITLHHSHSRYSFLDTTLSSSLRRRGQQKGLLARTVGNKIFSNRGNLCCRPLRNKFCKKYQ